jgi:hypothetical protein
MAQAGATLRREAERLTAAVASFKTGQAAAAPSHELTVLVEAAGAPVLAGR